MIPGFLLPVHHALCVIDAKVFNGLLRFLSSKHDNWREQGQHDGARRHQA
jgi:hypothetical protein